MLNPDYNVSYISKVAFFSQRNQDLDPHLQRCTSNTSIIKSNDSFANYIEISSHLLISLKLNPNSHTL